MFWRKFWSNKQIVRVVIAILTIFLLLAIGIAWQGDYYEALEVVGACICFLIFFYSLSYLLRNNE